jgi:hypothetical protein
MSKPWKAIETRVYFDGGGFDVRDCPDPEQLALFIVEAVNDYDPNAADRLEAQAAANRDVKLHWDVLKSDYDAQAALIAELVEELDAVRIIAAQAHRNYGNIGKETTFLLIIEERAAAALAKAKEFQP